MEGSVKSRLGHRGNQQRQSFDARSRINSNNSIHHVDARNILIKKKSIKLSPLKKDARQLLNSKKTLNYEISAQPNRNLLTQIVIPGMTSKGKGKPTGLSTKSLPLKMSAPFVIPKKTVKNEFYEKRPATQDKNLRKRSDFQLLTRTLQNQNTTKKTVPASTAHMDQKMDVDNDFGEPVNKSLTFTINNAKPANTTAETSKNNTPSSVISPIQGFRIDIKNLHPSVTNDDVYELFSNVGQLRLCSLVRPGHAQVVYNNKLDALSAMTRYNQRELDGMPMNLKLLTAVDSSEASSSQKAVQRKSSGHMKALDLDDDVIKKALFNVSGPKPALGARRPVNFSVSL